MANPFDDVINMEEDKKTVKLDKSKDVISFSVNKRMVERGTYIAIILILGGLLFINPWNSVCNFDNDEGISAVTGNVILEDTDEANNEEPEVKAVLANSAESEDSNTEITVTVANDALGPIDGLHPTGTYTPGESYTVILDKGETYSVVPAYDVDGAFGRDGAMHLHGTRIVVADGKKVAITIKDDSVKAPVGGGCYDLLGDQLVPLDLLGLEYIAMKGQLTTVPENLYIVATADNTDIWMDGNAGAPDATINSGGTYVYTFGAVNYVHIRASEPVIVLHVSGFGCEVGGAILPPTDVCTGSTQVGFTRSTDQGFFLNLMVRNGAEDGFLLNGAASGLLTAGDFSAITGTTDWLGARIGPLDVADIPVGTQSLVSNTKDVFHLGVINGSETGGTRFGYFSDFNEIGVSAFASGTGSGNIRACYGETVQLIAGGGTTYEWSPTTYLDDPYSATPLANPIETTVYVVTVSGACGITDSTSVTIELFPPLEAKFTMDTTIGCSPLDISIHDQSFGVREYYWDFGDGSPVDYYLSQDSIISDTTFIYTFVNTSNEPTDSAQTFEIELLVKNTNDCPDTLRRYVTVYPELTAGFDLPVMDDTIGCHPHVLNFQNLSDNEDYYLWEFGDGGSSGDENPVHTFNNFGNIDSVYTVSLVATSPYFCRDTATQDITIHRYIEADYTIDTTELCSPFNVNFTNSSKGSIDTYYWDFDGDGTIDSNTSDSLFSRQYVNATVIPDTMDVKLFVDNIDGCVDSLIREVIVYPPVTTTFNVNTDNGCDSIVINFTNNSTGNNLNYNWDFGDGGSSIELNPSHIYTNKDTVDVIFDAVLVATSSEYCADTFQVPITVRPFVEADFTIFYGSVCSPFEVTLTNASIGGLTYEWDFDGDGSVDSTTNNTNTFTRTFFNSDPDSSVIYEIGLEVTNSYSCVSTIKRDLEVYPVVLASLSSDITEGCNPLTVQFTDNSTGGNLTYNWDFKDGLTSAADTSGISHEFVNMSSNDTVYNVTLQATNANGCISLDSVEITVYPYVESDFKIDYTSVCTPFQVSFDNSSLGGSSFEWDLNGDGFYDTTTFNTDPFVRQYNNSDPDNAVSYNIELLVTNDSACTSTLTRQLEVYPPVISAFSADADSGCNPLNVGFTNNSTGGTLTYNWDFGDGRSSDLQNISHLFVNNSPSDTNYNVRLVTTNVNSCTDTTNLPITVYSFIESDFTIEDYDGCTPFNVTINNSSIGASEYYWDLGDGDTSSYSGSSFNHLFINSDPALVTEINTINLITKNSQGCSDSLKRDVSVYPEVISSFNAALEGCHPFSVDFQNMTSGAVYYDWTFGDGASSALTDPTHIYNNYGRNIDSVNTAVLIASSTYFCSDTSQVNITIHPGPFAGFSIDTIANCSPFTIAATNISNGTNLTYIWDYGDGNSDTTTSSNPVSYTYNNTLSTIEEFVLALDVETEYGCTDKTTQSIYVYPLVTSDFSFNSAGCSPFIVDFTNNSQNSSLYYWDFDDGITSGLEDPTHRFINTTVNDKVFSVFLKSTSDYGCLDTISYDLTVYPSPEAEFSVTPTLQIFPASTFTIDNTTNPGFWNYSWDFGDTTSSAVEEPISHTYSYWNNYEIRLDVSSANCSDYVIHEVFVVAPQPIAAITNPVPTGCVPLDVSFTTSTSYANSYLWDFGTGDISNTIEPNYTFEDPGIYNVKFLVTGDGGYTYDYQTVTVYRTPEAKFNVAPTLVMLPDDQIHCYNLCQYGATYLWDFGDGTTSTETEPMHLYTELGTYDIKLTVWSENQCVDSLIVSEAVNVVGAAEVRFPNAFTPDMNGPNGGIYSYTDTDNDVFHPYTDGVVTYHLEIYTRWGELIFISDDVNIGWDGYYKGELCLQDVYVWKVQVTFTNGQSKTIAGDVTLLHIIDFKN